MDIKLSQHYWMKKLVFLPVNGLGILWKELALDSWFMSRITILFHRSWSILCLYHTGLTHGLGWIIPNVYLRKTYFLDELTCLNIQCPSLPLVRVFALMSILSNVIMATLAPFWFPFDWDVFHFFHFQTIYIFGSQANLL